LSEAESQTRVDDTPADSQNSGTVDPVAHRHLLVFFGASSWMHQLPPSGNVVIGRSQATDLRIDDPSISRQHAKLLVEPDAITITDLKSQTGTFVNQHKIDGEHVLHPGDVVTIHKATLILHATPLASAPVAILASDAFRLRLDDELDRAVRYERAFSVLSLVWSAPVDRARIERAVTAQLRRIDAASWASDKVLEILLAEVTSREAAEAATRLRGKLHAVAPLPRIGHASCPTDGADADALLASARNAADRAEAGAIAVASHAYQTLTIGAVRVIVADPSVVRLYALIERLAPIDLPVLITGETGCGKELAATAIHQRSPRRNRPLISLNCAAIQETLVESELFGHEKGAFSGAIATKPGLLEAAHNSTLFLDEIGELALATQAKLLRVLETRRFTRVGDVRERESDVRIVAATNRDLDDEVASGRFRQDLYFRLSGATLHLPPLRERRRELPLLATTFLDEACVKSGRKPMAISDDALEVLLAHAWPGNIRELKNLMQYVAAAHTDDVVLPHHVLDRLERNKPDRAPTPPPVVAVATPVEFRPIAEEIRELEINRMLAALAASGGNQTKAASLLSMPVRTFFDKVKQYGLSPKKK
jgi:DNA-binding NtrC family response regulator/pSer/pThr/pTyr-binding forkhead associated (FHA) protein